MARPSTSAFIQRIIKKYGPVIDLKKNPDILIDIIRSLDIDGGTPEPPPPPPDDGGGLPGGVPNPPPAPDPPGPSEIGRLVTNEEVLRAVLQLSRDVASIQKSLKGVVARAPVKATRQR
jgi:hypothetical protein